MSPGVKLIDFHHNTLALSITGGILLMLLALLLYFCYRRLLAGGRNLAQLANRGPPMTDVGGQQGVSMQQQDPWHYPMMHSRMSRMLEQQQQEMNLRMINLESRYSRENQAYSLDGAGAAAGPMITQADRLGRMLEGTHCPPPSPVTRSHKTRRGEKSKKEFTFPEL